MKRQGIQLTIDREVWEQFKQTCESLGLSASGAVERFMKACCDKSYAEKWGRIYFHICQGAEQMWREAEKKKK
jgi:hypothetical protein